MALRDDIDAYAGKAASFFNSDRGKIILNAILDEAEAGGGGGTAGGSGGDFQINDGSDGFAPGPMNSNGSIIISSLAHRIAGNFGLTLRSGTDPDAYHGIIFETAAGVAKAAFQVNIAQGWIKIGGVAASYRPIFYSWGNEVATFFAGGEFAIGYTTNQGEKLQVNGQSRLNGITVIGGKASYLADYSPSLDRDIPDVAAVRGLIRSASVVTADPDNFTASADFTILPDLTSEESHDIALPSAAANVGREMEFWNQNSSGSNVWAWSVAITLPDGTTSTSIANDKITRIRSTGSVWVKINEQ